MKKNLLIMILVILTLLGATIIYLKFTDYEENEVDSEVSLSEILGKKSNSSWQSFKYEFVKDDGSIIEMEILDIKLKFGQEFLNVCIVSDDGIKSCEDLSFSYVDDILEVGDGIHVHFFGKYKISYKNDILTISRYNNNIRNFSYYFRAIT